MRVARWYGIGYAACLRVRANASQSLMRVGLLVAVAGACHEKSSEPVRPSANGGATGSAGSGPMSSGASSATAGDSAAGSPSAGEAGAGESGSASADAGASGYVRPPRVRLEPLTPVDLSPLLDNLSRDEDGLPILVDTGQARLVIDPQANPSPVTTLARCMRLLFACEDSGKALDVCWVSVPRCMSDAPWREPADCCPASCLTAYEALRKNDVEPGDAERSVFFDAPSCIPTLDQVSGRTP